MSKANYTAEDHRRAYDSYVASARNMSQTSRVMGIAYETVLRWRESNYACAYGCKFHGWDSLADQNLKVMEARNALTNSGVNDPIVLEGAIRNPEAVLEMIPAPKPLTPAEEAKVTRIVIKEEERLSHWYHLYAKVYYDLTGVVLDFDTLISTTEPAETVRARREILYKNALRCTNAENAIKTLGYIEDRIRAIESAKNADKKEITVLGNTPRFTPDQLRQIAALSDAFPSVVKQLTENTDSVG
jgi:hypothetical protein